MSGIKSNCQQNNVCIEKQKYLDNWRHNKDNILWRKKLFELFYFNQMPIKIS